ncbi:DUF2203 family protein [Chitinophaga varians]|uniref:DUF2203 family protein n=1 Tax=Chitinophaga varians TaxID=2202339 RepID=UPI00165F735E|nr:DUF2203 family protein [Chitinophaga varians]MBC9915492.1 DUF2203 family protein [Chitinophaga varians]
MDAANARELLAEIDNIVNDRFQDIIRYAKAVAEINERNINEGLNRIEHKTDQIDKTNKQNLELLGKRIESTADKLNRIEAEVKDPFNPGFMYWLHWFLIVIGAAMMVFLVVLASR